MAHLKSFAIFEAQLIGSIEELNEAAAAQMKVNPKAKEALTKELKDLSPEERSKLKTEVENLAKKLKLDVKDLTDTAKVAKAIVDTGMIKENFEFSGEDLNEGINVKRWWEKAKGTVFKVMKTAGIGSLLLGTLAAGIGAEMMPDVSSLPQYIEATPNTLVMAGGIAAGLGLISTLLGLAGSGELKDAASGAAGGRK